MKRALKIFCILLALALASSLFLFREESPALDANVLKNFQEISQRVPASGPLRVSATNPLYFTDGSGKAIYLTGSHVWNNLQDIDPAFKTDAEGKTVEPKADEHTPEFDFSAYLRFLEKENHNFIRLWTWEEAAWVPCSLPNLPYSPFATHAQGLATLLMVVLSLICSSSIRHTSIVCGRELAPRDRAAFTSQ